MFQPLPLFIGLRYVRSRGRGFFVSFISWISMLGICVGVAALITIISVMNGLGSEVRTRLLSPASHATLAAAPDRMENWHAIADKIRQEPGVTGVAPYLNLQGMVGRGQELRPALIRGIDPAVESQVSDIGDHMTAGSLDLLIPGEQRIVLGAGLAWAIEARVGDEITALVPTKSAAGEGMVAGIDLTPRIQTFKVVGIFEVGLQEHDTVLALVSLADASAFAGTGGSPAGLRLKFADVFAAPPRAREIAQDLGGGFDISDWTIENASYFRAVGIEKKMMSLILMLVVAVAAFNTVSALVMVVNEKRTDIAILRTLGISPRAVLTIFVTLGVVIGWFGALLGCLLGLLLAFNVETIVPVLEGVLGIHIFDPTVYYITEVPSEVHWPQVIAITATALILTVLATIYPALRGAATEPAEALRYE
jgi:lipoprotein-releasing system permease protein